MKYKSGTGSGKSSSIIIIGATRSGTNMLRDVLTKFAGVATWPCDEINYIWRHGNARYPSDEFTPDMATPAVQRYIRRQFDWVARRYQAHTVVEKTCANSLRVEFVDRVMPGARYIFIRRDGLDVVGSARKRWTADLDIPYLLRKVRFVPLADLPYYGGRYLWNRVYRLLSRERRLAFWGPEFEGMHELLQTHSLEEVCALQWRRCVEVAAAAFDRMPKYKYVEVAYEDFVNSPQVGLRRILGFLGLEFTDKVINDAVVGVTPKSVGRGRMALGDEMASHLRLLCDDVMSRYGY